jgi:hypothetical protein
MQAQAVLLEILNKTIQTQSTVNQPSTLDEQLSVMIKSKDIQSM